MQGQYMNGLNQHIQELGAWLSIVIDCPVTYPAFDKRMFKCNCGVTFPVYIVETQNEDTLRRIHIEGR